MCRFSARRWWLSRMAALSWIGGSRLRDSDRIAEPARFAWARGPRSPFYPAVLETRTERAVGRDSRGPEPVLRDMSGAVGAVRLVRAFRRSRARIRTPTVAMRRPADWPGPARERFQDCSCPHP